MIYLIPFFKFFFLTSALYKIDFSVHKGSSLFNSSPSNKRLLKRDIESNSSTALLEIINDKTYYAASFRLGTPEKRFLAQIDTGSSDLWVYGNSNPFCSSDTDDNTSVLDDIARYANMIRSGSFEAQLYKRSDNLYSSISVELSEPKPTIDCSSFGIYSSSDSSTSETNGTVIFIQYGDETFSFGEFYKDVLELNEDIHVENFTFGVANLSNSSTPVFGIGMEGLESTNSTTRKDAGIPRFTYPNLPSVLVENDVIVKRAYSLYLNALDADSGSVLFGGVDHAKYEGDLITVPIVNQFPEIYDDPIYFDVELTSLRYDGKELLGLSSYTNDDNSDSNGDDSGTSSEGSNDTLFKNIVLLDSGTTLIYLHKTTTDAVASELEAVLDVDSGYYQLSCPSNMNSSNLTFSFKGAVINVPLSNLLISSEDGKDCALSIQSTTDHQILGDVFLSSAYVVFDIDELEISLAQAKYTVESEIEEIEDEIPGAISYTDLNEETSRESFLQGREYIGIESEKRLSSNASSFVSSSVHTWFITWTFVIVSLTIVVFV